MWLHTHGEANFVKVSFCLQHCQAPLRMLEARPIKLYGVIVPPTLRK